MSETATPKNSLLAALPKKAYQQLLPKFERIELIFAEKIYNPGDVFSHVYFPESGIISLLAAVDDHLMLEVGIVGSEGMIGLPVFLGVKISNNFALVQGAGFALRMKAEDFIEECALGDELTRVLKRFTHSLMAQAAQSAACNRYHSIQSRMARWLLLTHDRMKMDKIHITQEFLSNMVGVRREAINKASRSFHDRGLISYNRGKLLILDLKGLKAIACNCYEVISKHHPDYTKR